MKTIIVASTNPAKIKATLDGFRRMFPDEEFEIEGVSVESGVRDQPTSDQETLQGALNRANNAGNLRSNGAVGILTGDVIPRSAYYSEAVVLALIPFKNPRLYS